MLRIVNMIPRTLSGETNQDSEPNIAHADASHAACHAKHLPFFDQVDGERGNPPVRVVLPWRRRIGHLAERDDPAAHDRVCRSGVLEDLVLGQLRERSLDQSGRLGAASQCCSSCRDLTGIRPVTWPCQKPHRKLPQLPPLVGGAGGGHAADPQRAC
jgi:hypothetical protein